MRIFAGVMELADMTGSNPVDSNIVWDRDPPPVPNILYHNGLSAYHLMAMAACNAAG